MKQIPIASNRNISFFFMKNLPLYVPLLFKAALYYMYSYFALEEKKHNQNKTDSKCYL